MTDFYDELRKLFGDGVFGEPEMHPVVRDLMGLVRAMENYSRVLGEYQALQKGKPC